jgi:hypothetical protein
MALFNETFCSHYGKGANSLKFYVKICVHINVDGLT